MSSVQGWRRAIETSLRRPTTASSLEDGGQPALNAADLRAPVRFGKIQYLVITALVAAGAVALGIGRPPVVDTAMAVRGPAIEAVYATGVVEHLRQARVSALMAAPIRGVFVSEGQHVSGGDLLAQLEDGPAAGTANQLEAQATMARLTAERVEALYTEGYASRAAWEEARGQRDATRAAAMSARAQLAYYTINAPFSGAVLRREAEPGDLALPSQVLFVIADETSLRVTADLDERDIARVAVGQDALVRADAFADRTFNATVAEITPQGDSATRVFRVRLALAGDTPLRAGMTVEANIITDRREDAVLVPGEAVSENHVWVVDEGRALRRTIARGATSGRLVEIRQGIEAGERVILEPPGSLRERARVSLRPSAPTAQPNP